MKKILRSVIFVLIGLFLVGLPFAVFAFDKKIEQAVNIGPDQIIEGNFIKFGNIIDIAGPVSGDVIVAGNSINISGPVAGDIIAAGSIIKISGPVGGNIRVFAGSVEISGQAERNVWALGGTVNLSDSSEVGWDLYAAGGTIEIKGDVGRNIWAGATTLLIGGKSGKDLNVSVGKDGQIILDPQAKIGGNLNYKAEDESQLIKKEGSEVLGETSLKNINDILISAPDKINKAFAATYLFLKVISLFSLLVIGIIIISLMPKIALKVHDQMSQKPAYSFGIGFIYFLVMPLISVFLFITIIGIPLSLIIIPIYLISLYIAKVFAGFTIGLIIFNKIFKGKYKQSLIIPLIFGLAIFVLLGSIPILGWIIKLLLVFWALGAMIKIKQEIVKEYS